MTQATSEDRLMSYLTLAQQQDKTCDRKCMCHTR